MSTLQDVAFYYPGHIWYRPEWVKTLLLFFDGIGLLVPEYKKNDPERLDPVLAGPLRDQGMLHYLIADEVVNKDATEKLVGAIETLVSSGAFDSLKNDDGVFHELSMSRMGYYGDEKLAQQVFERLKALELAKDSEDGASIPMHPMVRYTFLVLLAQIRRPQGAERGLDLSSTTDRPEIVQGFTQLLSMPSLPSAGHVVAFDLQNVSVDLATVPLDEVLDFRTQNRKEHRNYVVSARNFARELSLMSEGERSRAFEERQAELGDIGSDLRRTARKAWKAPVTFGLGLAGASWNYAIGNHLGALFAVAATLLRGAKAEKAEAGAYSYLFTAAKRYA